MTDRLDRYTLAVLLAVAAAMRLVNLSTRGTWEADQGHDMLTLRAMVQDGIVPLLGPPTSIGDVHHGAWYYYLLSPAAAAVRSTSSAEALTNTPTAATSCGKTLTISAADSSDTNRDDFG